MYFVHLHVLGQSTYDIFLALFTRVRSCPRLPHAVTTNRPHLKATLIRKTQGFLETSFSYAAWGFVMEFHVPPTAHPVPCTARSKTGKLPGSSVFLKGKHLFLKTAVLRKKGRDIMTSLEPTWRGRLGNQCRNEKQHGLESRRMFQTQRITRFIFGTERENDQRVLEEVCLAKEKTVWE